MADRFKPDIAAQMMRDVEPVRGRPYTDWLISQGVHPLAAAMTGPAGDYIAHLLTGGEAVAAGGAGLAGDAFEAVTGASGPRGGEGLSRDLMAMGEYGMGRGTGLLDDLAGLATAPHAMRAGVDDVVDRLNQRGPVPTAYSNPVLTLQQRARTGDQEAIAELRALAAAKKAKPADAPPARPVVESGSILDENGFYSPSRLAAMNLKQDAGTWKRMREAIIAGGGKPDEIRWMGLDERFKPDEKVTRDQLAELMGEFGDPVVRERRGGKTSAADPSEHWDEIESEFMRGRGTYDHYMEQARESRYSSYDEMFDEDHSTVDDLDDDDVFEVYDNLPYEQKRKLANRLDDDFDDLDDDEKRERLIEETRSLYGDRYVNSNDLYNGFVDRDEWVGDQLDHDDSLLDEAVEMLRADFENDPQQVFDDFDVSVDNDGNAEGTNYGDYFPKGASSYWESPITPRHYEGRMTDPYKTANLPYRDQGKPSYVGHDPMGESNIGWNRSGIFSSPRGEDDTFLIGEMQSDVQQQIRKHGLLPREEYLRQVGGPLPEDEYVLTSDAFKQGDAMKKLVKEKARELYDPDTFKKQYPGGYSGALEGDDMSTEAIAARGRKFYADETEHDRMQMAAEKVAEQMLFGRLGKQREEYRDIVSGIHQASVAGASDLSGIRAKGFARMDELAQDAIRENPEYRAHILHNMMSNAPYSRARLPTVEDSPTIYGIREEPYVTESMSDVQRRQLRQGLLDAAGEESDYFVIPSGETVRKATYGQEGGQSYAYEEVAPRVLNDILNKDLGLDPEIGPMPYKANSTTEIGTGFRLTPEIREAIRRKGLPYFALPGGMAAGGLLSGMYNDEENPRFY